MVSKPTWNSHIARLAAMDRAEVMTRLRQYWGARADRLGYRFKSSFLPEGLVSADVNHGLFFFSPAPVPRLCAVLKERFPNLANEIVARAERVCRRQFDLLGYEGLDYGPDIDW